jgi:Flp pilus assembly secretin CpaC
MQVLLRSLAVVALTVFAPLAAWAQEAIPLRLNTGAVLQTPEGTRTITLSDPRILSATPFPTGRYHIQATGIGRATVTAKLKGGGSEQWTYEVVNKPVPGGVDLVAVRGRGVMVELDRPATYLGSANKNLVHASPFESSRRFHVVGVGESGKVELLIVWPDGTEERRVVKLVSKLKADGRTVVSMGRDKARVIDLPARPTNVAVANARVAAAEVKAATNGFELHITAMGPGITDVVVSIGDAEALLWYTIIVPM